MNALAPKLTALPLRICVLAAEPRRIASLSQLVRNLGHVIVDASGCPSVVLTDGSVPTSGKQPTLVLGQFGAAYRARLPDNALPEQIDAALRAVAVGLSVTVAEEHGGFEAVREGDERILLTPREVEVLSAVSSGLTNKEIARELGISRHTVKFHLESLMRKLGASSRAEAVYRSIQKNLLEPYRL